MEDDRISQLPDQLISQILSHLPIKESVKSSVLSTRWRSLWLWVTDLELISKDYPDFDAFVGFGESFFDSNRVSSLHKLKLAIDEVYYEVDDVSYLTSWIDAAIKRKIQHLSFHWCVHRPFHMMNHLRLYNCETLVYLDLLGVSIDNAEFVSFPCLKTMHLDDILYPNEATLEKLVSCCCPVLEELKIFISDGGDLKGFQVHSLSLKRFTLIRTCAFNFDSVPGVVIDAPLLCCLRIYDEKSESFIVNNMKSNAQLVVSLVFGLGDFNESKRSSIRSFLGGISRVGDMTIHADTFKRFCQYSKVEPLPQFGYMSDLAAEICEPDLKCLPTFLESCPNLKSLTLRWRRCYALIRSQEMRRIRFSSVPKCLLSSLEFVYLKVRILGCAAETEIVRYFLENSAILKKLTLLLTEDSRRRKYFLENLSRIPIGSPKCEVVIL